jgi:hypothetical protein
MSDDTYDPFKDIPLGHTLIDWSDPTLTRDSITKQLIGSDPWLYWDDPEYAGVEQLEIERHILFDGGRPNWAGKSKHGKPFYQHMLTLTKLMFPDRDITPSVHDTFAFFCANIGGNGRKALHLIGSQNAGKSFGSCLLAFVTMFIDPTYTAVFVANPFDKSSESQAWGMIKELWFDLREAHPNTTGQGLSDACALFPWAKIYADRYIELIPGLPRAGAIRLQSVKHEGKFRGIKAFGNDVDRGVILLVIDEINLVDNHAFISMIDNLASQDAFQAISSQNFKDSEDLGGRVTEPSGMFGGPRTFDDLDIEAHHYWHSSKSSVTLRFDGHLAPNILAGRIIYPKLFKKENMDRLKESGGDQSPAYYSQCRSFPVRGTETNSVLSRAKISASRHLDPYFSLTNIHSAVSFVDPAFGGRDSAVWGCCYFGNGTVTDPDGEQRDQALVVFKDHFHRLKLVKDAFYNDYWLDRMKAAGIDVSTIVESADVSYEDQIAIQTKELNRSHGIPDANTGFDFSMRPDIVSSMAKFIGFAAHAFDYNQKPEGVFLQSIKQNSEECCKNRNTELAMLAADFFLTKQVRGGGFIETAITQLSRTLLESVNKKFVAEGKKEYKARWNNASPDHRDVLLGLAGMAVRKGFRANTVGPGKIKSAWAEINARNLGKSKIGRRI